MWIPTWIATGQEVSRSLRFGHRPKQAAGVTDGRFEPGGRSVPVTDRSSALFVSLSRVPATRRGNSGRPSLTEPFPRTLFLSPPPPSQPSSAAACVHLHCRATPTMSAAPNGQDPSPPQDDGGAGSVPRRVPRACLSCRASGRRPCGPRFGLCRADIGVWFARRVQEGKVLQSRWCRSRSLPTMRQEGYAG